MKYPLNLTPDDNGTFLVTSPDFPEVTSFGDSLDDAVRNGGLAVQEAIASRMDSFDDIPRPSGGDILASVPLALELKVQLFWALQEACMSRADLVKATGWPRTKVDRLFDPNHESKLGQLEEAFAALNKTVAIRMIAA